MWVNVALVAWSLHGTWDSSANCFACLLGPREECEVLRWEYLCWSVCLSVCLLAYLKNHMSGLHEIFSSCYPWPWLDPL